MRIVGIACELQIRFLIVGWGSCGGSRLFSGNSCLPEPMHTELTSLIRAKLGDHFNKIPKTIDLDHLTVPGDGYFVTLRGTAHFSCSFLIVQAPVQKLEHDRMFYITQRITFLIWHLFSYTRLSRSQPRHIFVWSQCCGLLN